MGHLLQRTLPAQGYLHALFCRSASACRQDDRLRNLSQRLAEWQVQVIRGKAGDTRCVGISQAVPQRKTCGRRRYAEKSGNTSAVAPPTIAT